MRKSTSLFLDLSRFVAALGVLLHHMNDWTKGALPLFAPMQTQGVIVFFVISGFVMQYVVTGKERDIRDFALSRAARIYSVALPALLFSFALYYISLLLTSAPVPNAVDFAFRGAAALLFLNELWDHSVKIFFNIPYWSLGYEVPYYVAFGLAVFGKGPWRWLGPGLVMLIVGPRVTLLGGVWLLGVAACWLTQRSVISERMGRRIFWTALVLFWVYYALVLLKWVPTSDKPIFWHSWEIATDYLIGTLFAAQIVGLSAMASRYPARWERGAQVVRWLAGATFSLYLFHFPIAFFVMDVLKPDLTRWQNAVLLGVLMIVGSFLAASLTERRKDAWKAALAACAGTLGPAPRDRMRRGDTN